MKSRDTGKLVKNGVVSPSSHRAEVSKQAAYCPTIFLRVTNESVITEDNVERDYEHIICSIDVFHRGIVSKQRVS